MDCAECSELLPLYTIGDLNDSEQTKVEEHLIHCWQCQEEIKEVRSVTQALYSLLKNENQKAHVNHEMNHISRKRDWERKEKFIRRATCTFLKNSIMAGPMGELVAIVGIHGVGGSIRAFTNAIRPIAAGRSAVFQGTYQMNGQPIRHIDGGFIRPGLAYHTIEEGEDACQKHTIVTNYLRGKALITIPSIKTALVIQLDNGPIQLSLSKIDGSEKLRNLIKQAQINFSGEVEYIGESKIKGEKVFGYCMNKDSTIWADAENLLPLQIEYSTERQLGLKGSINMTNITYNVPLNQNEFGTEVPEGYTQTVIHMNDSLPSEIDLINTLQMYAHTVDGVFPAALRIAEATELVGMVENREKAMLDGSREAFYLALQEYMLHYGNIIRGFSFAQDLPAESNWGYNCSKIKFGDSASPLFWYHSNDSETYRVIYGDLTIVDAVPEDLLQ